MKSFRVFIHELEELVVDCLRQSENMGWHHLPEDTVEFQHYLRLGTWAVELTQRRIRFDYIHEGKATRSSARQLQAWAASRDSMVGHNYRLHLGSGGAEHPDPTGRTLGESGHGDDDSGENVG